MGGPQSYPQEVPVRAASEAVPEGGPSTQLPPPSGLPQGFTSRKLVTVSPASTYAGQRTGPQPSAGGAPYRTQTRKHPEPLRGREMRPGSSGLPLHRGCGGGATRAGRRSGSSGSGKKGKRSGGGLMSRSACSSSPPRPPLSWALRQERSREREGGFFCSPICYFLGAFYILRTGLRRRARGATTSRKGSGRSPYRHGLDRSHE